MTQGDMVGKLRIAMLTTFYPPYSFGGDAIGIQRLAAAFAKRGHHVTVIHEADAYLTLAGAEPPPAEPLENVETIALRSGFGMASNLLTHQLGRPVVQRRRLREILTPGAFDIVWFHNVSLIGGPGLLAYGDGLKVYEAHEHWLVCPAHVLWRHNRELCDARECLRCVINYRRPPQLWRYTGGLERQLHHVDMFIAKSRFSRDKHREFGFPRDMEVIPYFLPDLPMEPAAAPPPHDRPYFLFVGRLENIKGLDDVIPAFADYPDADLLVIGSGEYEAELRRQAAGIPRVKFLGRMPPEDLARYYRGAVALIVPSVCYETFGIILIESFRMGTPVIARDIGPFGEIVERCNGGILFSDREQLVAAMRAMQADPKYRDSLAESARAGYEAHWREDVVVNNYFNSMRLTALAKGDLAVAAKLEEAIAK